MVHSFITVNNLLLWRSFDWPNCFTDISNHQSNLNCYTFSYTLPNFMGVMYQRKPSTALAPKEGTKNNYKQSSHSPIRTNFQSSEMFKITYMFR